MGENGFVGNRFVVRRMRLVVVEGREDRLGEERVRLGFISRIVDGLGFEKVRIRILENVLG